LHLFQQFQGKRKIKILCFVLIHIFKFCEEKVFRSNEHFFEI
jgi:hypothetical protein